jgi:hypothetical protein
MADDRSAHALALIMHLFEQFNAKQNYHRQAKS